MKSKTEANDVFSKILVFSDGACSGNPGPGGFGTVIVFPEGRILELGERRDQTTNNRMELVGAIKGLQAIAEIEGPVWMLTDSTYVIRGITQWIWGWKKKGWKTSAGKEVVNQDLWLALEETLIKRKRLGPVEWKYLRGHSGTPGNERCDEIAVEMTHQRRVELYSGSLLDYPYAIYDLPDDLSLPASKPATSVKEKQVAYSYLSYVNGELKRHSSWKECEARVKGRPGAKFKKSLSAEQEKAIVSEWGVSPHLLETLSDER